jgi:dolichyl-diphosphooligosaccharide--protein glycosyltransferase
MKLDLSRKFIAIGCLMLCIAMAIYIRLQAGQTLLSIGGATLLGNDAYYHLRNVQYILANFPQTLVFDTYMQYPIGLNQPFMPLYDLFIAIISWCLGFGNPSSSIVYNVCLYAPITFMVISIIMTFFLGRELFESNEIGIWSAIILATIPGTFFITSLVGYNDSTSAEIALSIMVIYAIVRGILYLEYNDLVKNIKNCDCNFASRALACGAIGGFLLTILTYTGGTGIYLAPIICVYFLISQFSDYTNGKDIEDLTLFGCVFFLSCLVTWLFIPHVVIGDTYTTYISNCGSLIAIVGILAYNVDRIKAPKTKIYTYFAFVLVTLFVLFRNSDLSILPHITAPATELELKSIFTITDDLYFTNFAVCGYIAILGLGVLYIRKLSGLSLFVFIWIVGTMTAAVIQSRFSCYLAVGVAIMTAFSLHELYYYMKEKFRKNYKIYKYATGLSIFIIGIITVIIFSANWSVASNTIDSYNSADNIDIIVNEPWVESLTWLSTNTPKLNMDINNNLQREQFNATSGLIIKYPKTTYGVLSAGARGNAILMLGNRLPVATQYAKNNISGDFFSAQTESGAIKALNSEQNAKIKYIITDNNMITESFSEVTQLNESMYTETLVLANVTTDSKGKPENINFSIPTDVYYNTMLLQLHVFDGINLRHFKLVKEYGANSTIENSIREMYENQYGGLKINNRATSGSVKIFEYVKGANVIGNTRPNKNITISTLVETNLGRSFVYKQTTTSDGDGDYYFIVPYALDYNIIIDSRVKTITINNDDIMNGATKVI